MYMLSRKLGESFQIGDITIKVVKVQKAKGEGRVRLAISLPDHMEIKFKNSKDNTPIS